MANPNLIERTHCPACRGTRRQTIYRCPFLAPPLKPFLEDYYRVSGRINFAHLDGADFILDECLDCGLVYQRMIPAGALLEDLYRVVCTAERGEERLGHGTQTYFSRQAEHLLMVRRYFRRPASRVKVLDFGFGWAEWAALAQGFGFNLYGAELDEDKKAHARRLGIRVVEWDDLPGSNFDYIHTDWVFEHLTEPLATLEHLARSLAPGGLIKISVPYRVGIKRRLRANRWQVPKNSRYSLNAAHPLEHVNTYEGSSLDRMAARCGLQPIHFKPQGEYMVVRWGAPAELLKALLRPPAHRWNPRYSNRYYRLEALPAHLRAEPEPVRSAAGAVSSRST